MEIDSIACGFHRTKKEGILETANGVRPPENIDEVQLAAPDGSTKGNSGSREKYEWKGLDELDDSGKRDVSSKSRNAGGTNIYPLRGLNENGSSSSGLGFSGSGLLGAAAEIKELKRWTRLQRTGFQVCPITPSSAVASASLLVDPAVSVVRILVFYVLLQTGVAGRGAQARNQAEVAEDSTADRKDPFDWIRKVLLNQNPEESRAKELAKVRAKWHASTKGTLVRRYRVPTKAQGRKLLGSIMQLLSDDDSFRDVATHKGCQIRRENAHAESVCCHNVRALFDELPTPHLVVEITVFPAGPITEVHYEKAEKIEKVLKTGQSI
ncbi:hypothetical protein R1flu_009357 [Riccia fluitans]|uniref:Uncharacterized protein n=1 Tax=Riccia fluitans TaxID=41844 RepID=A0ABD1Z240_9MARC